MDPIRVKKLRPGAALPTRGSADAAGADLRACLDGPLEILPGQTAFVGTGIAVEIPSGYAGLVFARSGLASRKGLAPANKVGVVDSDYRGEILISPYNHGPAAVTVAPGDRVAQLVLVPVLAADFAETDTLSDTGRGAGGFGSTGK